MRILKVLILPKFQVPAFYDWLNSVQFSGQGCTLNRLYAWAQHKLKDRTECTWEPSVLVVLGTRKVCLKSFGESQAGTWSSPVEAQSCGQPLRHHHQSHQGQQHQRPLASAHASEMLLRNKAN